MWGGIIYFSSRLSELSSKLWHKPYNDARRGTADDQKSQSGKRRQYGPPVVFPFSAPAATFCATTPLDRLDLSLIIDPSTLSSVPFGHQKPTMHTSFSKGEVEKMFERYTIDHALFNFSVVPDGAAFSSAFPSAEAAVCPQHTQQDTGPCPAPPEARSLAPRAILKLFCDWLRVSLFSMRIFLLSLPHANSFLMSFRFPTL